MNPRGGIAFLGTSTLAAACCETLIETGVSVERILSIPREFRISWANAPVVNAQFADLGVLARRHSIPFSYVTSGRAEDYTAALGPTSPDLLVVAGWYYMVPGTIMARSRLGAVGLHGSLLPRYRGGAPLVWAIINGEVEAGVTLFHLTAGVDDGDIVARSAFPISSDEEIGAVVERATQHSVALMRAHIPGVLDGTAARTPQDERAATVMAQRTAADGLIRWEALTGKQAHDWVRAQTTPYPGAFTYLGGTKVLLWVARHGRRPTAPRQPGMIEVGEGLSVSCADGTVLEIIEASIEEGGRLTAKQLIAAAGIRDGARFACEPGER